MTEQELQLKYGLTDESIDWIVKHLREFVQAANYPRSNDMLVTVTAEQLKAKDACSTGIQDFITTYGESITMDWTPETQVEIVKSPMRQWLGWAWAQNIIPQWSMARADLSDADLRGADLRCANLSGANLSGAYLSGANLRCANLSDADLSDADLSDAYLSGVTGYTP